MTHTLLLRVLAAILALSVVGVACASDATTDSATDATTSEETSDDISQDTGASLEAVPVDTGAPALVSGLTDLLDSHVYLAAIAVEQAVITKSTDSPQFKAAAGALDRNSVDLSKAIGSVYGTKAEKAFLKQWRAHIGFFVEYTVGRMSGDEAAEKAALKKLGNYKNDFAAFLSEATGGELPADGAAAALQMHVDSLIEVINSVVDGEGDPFTLLYEAASGHMPMTATALAGAIAAQNPEDFPGDVASAGSELQQTLTDLLDSHVYLAAIAVEQAVITKSTDSPQFTAAAGALDRNSVDLSKAIGSVYGTKAEKAFLKQWRAHIGFFVEYAVGRLGGDEAAQKAAGDKLANYKKDFAAFLSEATGGELPADAAAEALQAHVDSLVGVVNAVVDGEGDPFALLYEAAHGHMPHTATALSAAIIGQMPEQFPTS